MPVITKQDNLTGLEDQLRLQANEYFAAARAATSRILKQAPSNLANLQALTYGVGSPIFCYFLDRYTN